MQQTSSILDRNQHAIFPIPVLGKVSDNGVSSDLRWHKELTPKELVRFLFWLHDRRGFKPQRTMVSLVKEAKGLTNSYSQDELQEAMLKAANVSKHPWGFKFVKGFLEGGRV